MVVNDLKALYVHDHRFAVCDGRVYSRSAYPSRNWDRYSEFFSHIRVVGRGSEVDPATTEKLDLSEHPSVSFELISERKGKNSLLRRLDAMRHNRRLVRQSDAVILRIPNRYALIFAFFARRYRKPIGIEVSGCAWDAYWNHGSLLAKIYAPYAYLSMRKVARMADAALYVTRTFLQRRYPTDTGTPSFSASNVEIHSTIELGRARDLSRRMKERRKIVFGTIGNYRTRYKGIHDAITALGRLKTSVSNFEYRILGAGDPTPYQAIAENQGITERVRFHGTLPRGDKVLEWLDEIDIYLQPSYTEGLPRTLVEAMSRGKIAIGSTVGGIPELLPGEFMHAPGNVDELSDRIKAVLEHPDLERVIRTNILTSGTYVSSRLRDVRKGFLQAIVDRIEAT